MTPDQLARVERLRDEHILAVKRYSFVGDRMLESQTGPWVMARDAAQQVRELRAELESAVERDAARIADQHAHRDLGQQHAVLLAERDTLATALADAAMEINCAGPVVHRILVLKREYQAAIESLRAERDTLVARVQQLEAALTDPYDQGSARGSDAPSHPRRHHD